MKKALKFLAATLVAFSLLGFMSCDDEESTTYYKITVGETEHGTVPPSCNIRGLFPRH